MIRRSRFVPTVLAVALAAALLPASSVGAATGTPLRPAVRAQADPNPDVILRGSGWGHSVGMSQYGAYAMARAGKTHDQILKHYYPGTEVAAYTGSQEVTVRLFDTMPSRKITNTLKDATAVAVGAVSWQICELEGACRAVTQSDGHRWRIRSVGTSAPSQITVHRVDANGAPLAEVYAGTGTVTAGLSPTSRILTKSPNGGSKQYGYGALQFQADGGVVDVINRLPLENYVRGIDEVSSSWGLSGGRSALDAQATIARGYVLSQGRDTCATARCQVFNGYQKELGYAGTEWADAVTRTAGKYLRAPDGKVAQTFFSSSHGGRTEAIQDSWAYGGKTIDYLPSVDDPWSLDAVNPLRSWTGVATNYQFRRVAGSGLSRVERVQIVARTAGGSPRTLRVTGPEGTRDFTGGTGSCNRAGHAANALRCDLDATIYNAAGAAFTGGGRRPPSSQIRSIGFAPFTDDDGATHEYATVWANAAGIAFGTTPTTFAPGRGVTREQMASFIYRTFDVPKRTDEPFTDVNGGPHAEAIASITAAGIAHGFDSRTYGPKEYVSREQMASFIARAMGLSPVHPNFSDVAPNGTHGGNIGAIAARGITSGCGGDRYCPRETVTRGQMTAFLYRAVKSLR